ncbi:AI-2E family transporter [Candidatus Methylocalor cossyra]|uniref:PurR-regulated permease PerM n=1 Tax=Candidatus Methylocalor cossyra TaxID=3108543 RepID=A0ABM9NG33_9GAMM
MFRASAAPPWRPTPPAERRARGRIPPIDNARYGTLGLFLAGLGFLIFQVLRDLIEPVVWAIILVYSTWPLHEHLQRALRGHGGWSALLMVVVLGSLLIVPFIGLSVMLQRETVDFFHQLPAWLERKPELPGWVERIPFFGRELRVVFDQFEDLQGLVRKYLMPWATGFSGRFLSMLEGAGFIVAKLFFTLFLMFFFYRDGSLLVSEVRRGLARGLGRRGGDYLATAEITIRAVVYGVVLTALVQGLVAGLGYWGAGLKAPVLLGLFTMFAALIPFGTVVVWTSAGLWLLFHGQQWAGIGLLLWGALVVSWIDNVVRPLVISRTTQIPFVLVMLGVLGGLGSFGFIGLFVGPVILAIGLAVWREWLKQPDGSGQPS